MGILEEFMSKELPKPIGSANGVPIYTFEDMQEVNNHKLMEEKLTGKDAELGTRPINPDGTYTSVRKLGSAVNIDRYLANRMRIVKDGTKVLYHIVDDYRAIQEQKNGRVYTNVLPAYVITANNHKLNYVETINVSDKEFINEFTKQLSNEDMIEVKKILPVNAGEVEKVHIL